MSDYEPTVFVVDDDEAVRLSLSMLVETVGLKVRTFKNGQEFLDSCERDQAGCVVLDVRMPGMSGLEVQAKLNQEGMDMPVIIVTGHGDVPMAVEALKAGAVDFVEKPFRDQTLLDNIQEAIELDARNRRSQAQQNEVEAKKALLTRREQQVMELLVAGKNNKTIAYELQISQKTVDFHRANVLAKMGVRSVVELVRLVR
jgi:FixJ family two-component response regulator